MRLKARGPTRGCVGSERGRPVPFVSGRPPPSCSVQFASNNSFPLFERSSDVKRNSPSPVRCCETESSAPITEARSRWVRSTLCAKLSIAKTPQDRLATAIRTTAPIPNYCSYNSCKHLSSNSERSQV